MNEQAAREVLLLQAFETVEPASPSWGDDDRAWATRLALEESGAAAPGTTRGGAGGLAGSLRSVLGRGRDAVGRRALGAFVERRAHHALQRLAPREPALATWLRRPFWRARWVVWVALAGLVLGALADSIGSQQRINLLALPTWGLVVWNLVVYALLLGHGLFGPLRRDRPGLMVRLAERAMRIGRGLPLRAEAKAGLARAGGAGAATPGVVATFASLWSRHAAPLSAARAATLLHVGAAALALGLVAGLYGRGLVLDYRAGWESTFLDAGTAHAFLATVLAPASALSGIALPDLGAFEALRRAHGSTDPGGPAAPWIHLIALTLVLVVVLPRAVLALAGAMRARWRADRIALPLGDVYFQRLARQRSGDVPSVVVVPYASAPPANAAAGLAAILKAAYGDGVRTTLAPTVGYGAHDADDGGAGSLRMADGTTLAFALFDLAATPEAEVHGAFARALAAAAPEGAATAVLVDEGAFRRRFGGDAARLAQRRDAWRAFAEGLGTAPAFVDLQAVDAAAASAAAQALEAALRRPVASARRASSR